MTSLQRAVMRKLYGVPPGVWVELHGSDLRALRHLEVARLAQRGLGRKGRLTKEGRRSWEREVSGDRPGIVELLLQEMQRE